MSRPTPPKPCFAPHFLSSIRADLLFKPTRPPGPQLRPRPYRLNVLAAHDDILYIAASNNEITRVKIHRSRGIVLQQLPFSTISPPTVINNVRVAPFNTDTSSHVLLLTGGSENQRASGRLVLLPLTSARDPSPPIAKAFRTRTNSAWGLDVHPYLPQIAVSSNSRLIFIYNFRQRQPCTTLQHNIQPATHPAHNQTVPDQQQLILTPNQPQQPAQLDESQSDADSDGYTDSEPSDLDDPDDQDDHQYHIDDYFEQQPHAARVHLNNIPCVSFHKNGHLLASASIDCTFAIYDTTTPHLPSAFQSGLPAARNHYYTHTEERCWQTHWITPSTILHVSEHHKVWRMYSWQRSLNPLWVVLPSFVCEIGPVPPLLTRYGNTVRRAQTKVFYDDRQLLEPSHRSPRTESQNPHSPDNEPLFDINSVFDEPTACQREVSIEAENKQPFAIRTSLITENNPDPFSEGELMLVCFEKSIELHHVLCPSDPIPHANGASEAMPQRRKARKLDSIQLNTRTCRQLMVTQVIEIAPLSLLVCIAVNIGVIFVRILRSHTPKSLGDPSLFIERVIHPRDSICGACVIERPGSVPAEFCAELWIFTTDGLLQCWELSRDGLELDISTPV